MLEIIAYLVKTIGDLLFWLQNKEQDAAVRRIKTLDKLSKAHAAAVIRLEKEKEAVEEKYFNSVEE